MEVNTRKQVEGMAGFIHIWHLKVSRFMKTAL